MTHRTPDWPAFVDAVTAADEARLWDQGAEEALDQAVDIAGTRRDGTEHALIGIGMALRATNARMDALTAELGNIADALDAARAPRRSWWRRLADRFGRRVAAPDREACPADDGPAEQRPAEHGGPGDQAKSGIAPVTQLRRSTEVRS